MADASEDRIFPATPRRRKEAREAGQVAKSDDLTAAILLAGGLLAASAIGPLIAEHLMTLTRQQLSGNFVGAHSATTWFDQWTEIVLGLGKVALPALAVAFALPVLTHLIQTRFFLRPQQTVPDWSRCDPVRGWQRIASGAGTARSGFGILKILAIGSVTLMTLHGRHEDIIALSAMAVEDIASSGFDILLSVLMHVAAALFFLAVLDYAYQRWKHERKLMMTAEELREEFRNDESRRKIVDRRRSMPHSGEGASRASPAATGK